MSALLRTDELHQEAFNDTSPTSGAAAPQLNLSIEPSINSTIWARFIEPFITGDEPCCRSVDLSTNLDMDAAMACIPAELVARQMRSNGNSIALIETDTYAAVAQRFAHRSGSLVVRAATAEAVDAAVAEVSAWFPVAEPEPESVSVDFWQSARSMFTTSRTIDAPSWHDVAHHYPAEIGEELAGLVNLTLDEPDGRVILWHGPPGTGKTSAIRTLARAWRDQATFQVVLDPEPVFSHSANLMQVILDDSDQGEGRWRVLVIEDADEIVRADNVTTSQSLSRLLNVGDGIVGQGLKVLVLLTTNEPPARLHPALTRPGRCLTNTAFRKFTQLEASAAFPETDLSGTGELSLAEILTGRVESTTEASSYGQYL